MKKLISEWIEENPISEDLYWKGPARNQINYVRDEIASGLLGEPCYVISQHCSKSVRLPVYQINYKGLEIIMRDNFYGWIVSLKSELPLLLDQDLIYYDSGMDEKEEKIPSCYCEGFVEELWEESRALELEGENIDPYSGSDEFFYVEILR